MNRRRRRRRPTFTDSEITLTGTVRGCACRPDLKRRHINGQAHVAVRHDHNCPVVDTGPQLLLRRDPHQSATDFARDVIAVLRALEGSA